MPQATDTPSVSAAYREHETFLKRFLKRFVSNREDIDDLVQETFLRAYTAEQGSHIHTPKAFLFRIARNLALNELRRRSGLITNCIADLSETEVISEQASVEDQVAERERLAIFCKAAAALPIQCRRAFLMRKVYGFSQQEIARELNISVSTVEKHLATGLLKCDAYMRVRGYEPVRQRAAKGRKD